MTSADLALLITAIFGGIGGLLVAIAALINAKSNKNELDETREEVDILRGENKNSKLAIEHNRESLIRVGEQLALTRSDNAKLALLVKQLYEMYQQDTGRKPAINWKNFDDMMALTYITGPIGEIKINS